MSVRIQEPHVPVAGRGARTEHLIQDMRPTTFLTAALCATTTALLTQQPRLASLGDPRIPLHADTTPGDADSVFRIEQPGSYYLRTPLVGRAGLNGIEIAASGVTLDLMGFPLLGVPGSLDGIVAEGPGLSAIALHGGTVRGFGGDGVDLTQARGVRLRGLDLLENGGDGAALGPDALVFECQARGNQQRGIHSPSGLLLADSIASENGQEGVVCVRAGLVEGVLVEANGADGMELGGSSSAERSIAIDNGSFGVLVGEVARGVVASHNSGIGISTSLGVLEGCVARNNGDDGLRFNGVAHGNVAASNASDGLRSSVFGGHAHGNFARNNQDYGLYLTDRSVAESNVLTWNQGGMRADGRSLVRGNFSSSNSGSNYFFFGTGILHGPEQDISDGTDLVAHPGVNVED